MSALCRTTCVTYRVVETIHYVNGKDMGLYGVECTDGVETLRLASLSYDYDRVKNLVEDMNEAQIPMCYFKEVVHTFFENAYGIDLH